MKRILLSVCLGVLALAILVVSKVEAAKLQNQSAKDIIFDSPDKERLKI